MLLSYPDMLELDQVYQLLYPLSRLLEAGLQTMHFLSADAETFRGILREWPEIALPVVCSVSPRLRGLTEGEFKQHSESS